MRCMLIHITFRNTSMRWNMKRSNGFPEFSAGLLLFDCCFSPLNNIDKCEAIGIMMTMGRTFQNSEVLMIHSYSLHMDGMGWNLYQLGWDLHGPWSPCGVFSRFFCPGVEERSCTLHGSFDIHIYMFNQPQPHSRHSDMSSVITTLASHAFCFVKFCAKQCRLGALQ